MQPTRAQVVPYGPASIRIACFPRFVAARNAAIPAVPAPMIATSTSSLSVTAASVMKDKLGPPC